MSRTDKILHTTLDTNVDQGPYSYAGTWEAWIEPERNRARVSIRSGLGTTSSELRATEIILDEDIYANESGGRTHKRKALTCRGTDDPILSIMLGCQGALEESNTTLQTSARYQDRAVLALVTVGTSRGEDESWIFTDTLYVDPLTYLPIAQEQTGTLDIGEKYPVKGTTRFTNEFVAADSQPPDLFDPVAIGYVELTPTPSTD